MAKTMQGSPAQRAQESLTNLTDSVQGSQAWNSIFRPGSIFRKGYSDSPRNRSYVIMNSVLYHLHPWDQLALWAVTVGTNMMGYTPVLGGQVRFVLLGGKEIGTDTLLRWYVLHVLFFPFIIVIFMAIHFWRVRKDGGISGPL